MAKHVSSRITSQRHNHIMRLLIVAVVGLLAFACNQAPEQSTESTSAVIQGTIDGADSEVITLYTVPVLGQSEEIASDTLDTDGEFRFEVEMDQPALYQVAMNRRGLDVFLHPGDELSLTASAEDLTGTWLFEGTGSKVANYIADKAREDKAYKAGLEESNLYKLEEKEFTEALFGMQDMQTELLNKRFPNEFPSPEFEAYATYSIIGAWASQMNNYPDYHGYYTGKEDFEVSSEFEVARSKVALDSDEGLIAPAYRSFAFRYASEKLNEMVTEDTTLQEDWEVAYAKQYYELEKDKQVSDGVRDYLLASNVNDFITYFGTENVEEIYQAYLNDYGNPDYVPVIQKTYDAWKKLSKGEIAPTFAYENLEGETIDLAEMKGKVVYVDIWATWCGPCKGEIPASKELKKKFADRDDVIFMYVSVDEEKGKWIDFLQADPEFKGTHVITGTGWQSKITDDYMIDGIPRYLLIDQEGMIVSASAPRPSSGEKIEGMIRELLVENPSGD